MKTKRWLRLLAVLFSFALVAASCGDDDDESADDGDTTEDTGDDGGGELEEAPGFDGETIRVGIISDLSGPAAVIGEPLTNGNRVFFEALNAEGGIAGQYPVELVEVDSTYNPATGVQVYNQIKEDVAVIGQILGTPVTNAIIESLEQDGIIASPASLDSLWVREPNLIPVGAPYQIQMINGFDHYFNEGDGDVDSDVVCALVQDDPYGEAGLAGLEFAAENIGFEIEAITRYVSGDTDFSAQMNELEDAGCTVNAFVALPSVTGSALGAAATNGYAPQWIGTSPTWINVLAQSELAPYLEANFTVISDAPDWGDTSVPGMERLIADQEEYAPDQVPDGYFIFGYYEAQSITALLEKAVELGDLSREGIQTALEELGTVSYGGLTGDYTYGPPEERVPPRNSNIAAVVPDAPNGLENQTMDYEADYVDDFEL
ncbi:MAG: ABC transporter substrate-binding protein [Acidimicrobiales bacterium]|nr:ABC transporter substrate-binding protein [Acidimicrobiales bacterium]